MELLLWLGHNRRGRVHHRQNRELLLSDPCLLRWLEHRNLCLLQRIRPTLRLVVLLLVLLRRRLPPLSHRHTPSWWSASAMGLLSHPDP